MTTPIEILIVEDDPIWHDQHVQWFQQAEFRLYPTNQSAIALEYARQYPKISVGVIDEILFVPPVLAGVRGELQHLQGEGVIRKIRETGATMKFIFITSAPSYYSLINQTNVFLEASLLRCIPGVVAVIHKEEMQGEHKGRIYFALIELIRWIASSPRYPISADLSLTPGVYIMSNFNSNFNINGSNIGAIAPDSTIHGGQFAGAQIHQIQDLSEAAADIQALLTQLSTLYPDATDETLAKEVVKQVNQEPQLKGKIMRAIRDAGIETVKQMFDHPAAKIAIAALEGFKDPS